MTKSRQIKESKAKGRYSLIEGAIIAAPYDRFVQVINKDGSHWLEVTHIDGSTERFITIEGRLTKLKEGKN